MTTAEKAERRLTVVTNPLDAIERKMVRTALVEMADNTTAYVLECLEGPRWHGE